VWQATRKLLKTQDTCSHISPKESESANLELFSSKMLKESSAVKPTKANRFSNMSSEDWKKWVTEQRQEYSQRVKSERLIRESESSSLVYPTPRSSDGEGGMTPALISETGQFYRLNKKGEKWSVKLRDAVESMENWSTPVAMNDGMYIDNSPNKDKRHSQGLATQAYQSMENWSTPRASATDSTRPNRKGGIPLAQQVKEKNWATPNTMEYREPRSYEAAIHQATHSRKGRNDPCNLREQVDPTCVQAYKDAKDFPTPTTRDWKGAYPKASQEKRPRNLLPDVAGENTLQDLTKNNTNGKNQELLKLNPDWVEQLMGLPVGWTDCDFSEIVG
jgi:hypothetical protein